VLMLLVPFFHFLLNSRNLLLIANEVFARDQYAALRYVVFLLFLSTNAVTISKSDCVFHSARWLMTSENQPMLLLPTCRCYKFLFGIEPFIFLQLLIILGISNT
jgi:hypothetical protein